MAKVDGNRKALCSLTKDNLLDGYRKYSWNNFHVAFGYEYDRYPDFDWISSLEKQFQEIRDSNVSQFPHKAFVELLAWGQPSNKRDPSGAIANLYRNFTAETNSIALIKNFQTVISEIKNPERAIRNAMNFKGIGFVFATKLLRFMEPEIYGAFDSIICNKYFNGFNPSKLTSRETDDELFDRAWPIYGEFLELLRVHQNDLSKTGRPASELRRGREPSGWRIADIEMAMFQLAKN